MSPIRTIETLSHEINLLFSDIKTQRRLLRDQQIKVGKLLIELRDKFAVKNSSGVILRGPKGGTFCAHVAKMGWNLGTCYHYISLVDPKLKKDVNREAFWQSMNRKMKKASPVQKIALLKRSIAHLVKLYKIPVTVSVAKK